MQYIINGMDGESFFRRRDFTSLLYDENTPGTGGGSRVASETVAGIARADKSLIVQIIGALAIGAGAETVLVHADGIGAYGQGVGVEAVGTLTVVGIEGSVERVAVSYDEGTIVAQNVVVALVESIKLNIVRLSLIAYNVIVACTVFCSHGHGNETAGIL